MIPLPEDDELKFHEFWDSIIFLPDGEIDKDAVFAELYDYQRLLLNVTPVYDYATGGQVRRPNMYSGAVIQHIDNHVEVLIKTAVADVLRRLSEGETIEDLSEEFNG